MEYIKTRNGAMIGSIGAGFLAVGDWLIGYLDPTSIGDSMILIRGCNEVGYVRPVLSMFVAIIGVIMCTYGILCMTDTILEESKLRILYRNSVIWGSLQWLFIHFVFCGFRYIYQYLWNENYRELAYRVVNVASEAFMPVFLISYVIIIIPYVAFFIALLKKKTVFPRWTASFYMLTFTVIFKTVAAILGKTPMANGFSTASNNMAITIWLLCVCIYLNKYYCKKSRRYSE